MSYLERLAVIGLEPLELRRLHAGIDIMKHASIESYSQTHLTMIDVCGLKLKFHVGIASKVPSSHGVN